MHQYHNFKNFSKNYSIFKFLSRNFFTLQKFINLILELKYQTQSVNTIQFQKIYSNLLDIYF